MEIFWSVWHAKLGGREQDFRGREGTDAPLQVRGFPWRGEFCAHSGTSLRADNASYTATACHKMCNVSSEQSPHCMESAVTTISIVPLEQTPGWGLCLQSATSQTQLSHELLKAGPKIRILYVLLQHLVQRAFSANLLLGACSLNYHQEVFCLDLTHLFWWWRARLMWLLSEPDLNRFPLCLFPCDWEPFDQQYSVNNLC